VTLTLDRLTLRNLRRTLDTIDPHIPLRHMDRPDWHRPVCQAPCCAPSWPHLSELATTGLVPSSLPSPLDPEPWRMVVVAHCVAGTASALERVRAMAGVRDVAVWVPPALVVAG